MAFTQKLLSYEITLQSGGSPITLSGLRSSCKIDHAGPPSRGTADIAIYGMTLSQMNSLTTFARQINLISKNKIRIQAGDTNGMSLIFEGTISTGFMDGQAMPEVCFRLGATAGLFEAVMQSTVTSTQGSGDVATIAGQLADRMGLHFENNNVQVKLSNPYLSGSYGTQMQTLAEHAGIQYIIDRGVLAIWPTGKSRGDSGVMVSAQTGMVGYSAFNQAGVIVTALFNPALAYAKSFTVKSDLTPANGKWTIYNLFYDLESMTPHGKWFATLSGSSAQETTQPSGDQG